MQHLWEGSFFDAPHSLLPRIFQAEDLGIDPAIPLLVSEAFLLHSKAADFLQPLVAGRRRIVVHRHGHRLRCRSLYLLDPYRFDRASWDRISAATPAADPPAPIGPRIALIRGSNAFLRRVTRGYDILVEALCAAGFDRVDPGALSVGQQKRIFAAATHIVTENGGALTNIMHRLGRPLRIDSLIAADYRTTTFQVMSTMYGYDFRSHVLPSTRTAAGIEMQLDRDTAAAILASARETE
nr:glycosyltransferase 61 family protein [Roseibacterium persicicum]